MTQSTMGTLISRLLRGPGESRVSAGKLFNRLVAQARQPVFFHDMGVPDTVDGRFDLLVMHLFVVFRRLKGQGDRGAELSQALYDVAIQDMEASLRQLGAGDAGVGKRIRIMTEALQGRVVAYEAALAGNSLDLEGAVRRNLYGTVDPDIEAVRVIANYLRRAKELADAQPLDNILRGAFEFPPPPQARRVGDDPSQQ